MALLQDPGKISLIPLSRFSSKKRSQKGHDSRRLGRRAALQFLRHELNLAVAVAAALQLARLPRAAVQCSLRPC
jgi:hypothetical protein